MKPLKDCMKNIKVGTWLKNDKGEGGIICQVGAHKIALIDLKTANRWTDPFETPLSQMLFDPLTKEQIKELLALDEKIDIDNWQVGNFDEFIFEHSKIIVDKKVKIAKELRRIAKEILEQ